MSGFAVLRGWARSQKAIHLTTFSDLGLDALLIKALGEEGYQSPTPIQSKAIPGVLAGRDLLGIAQTGTGKTAAFALPILHRLAADRRPAPRKGCRALILSPTRELATQIGDSFRTYGRHLNLSVSVVFGGVAHRPQITALARGLDVLVATPGRLIDHMDERNVLLESTEVFVLDEADQMLDLGFVRPIRRIVSKLSMKRQNLFFSATMPHEIGALAAELLNEPVKVSVAPSATTVERVSQRIILIEQSKKRSLLVELLTDAAMQRTLVFTRTKRGADKVARHLETAGISCSAIHGTKSQGQREAALAAFRADKIRVLVATDIAARGIDIDQVTHVVNFELPDVPESYVHRIGRTARAGASGIAIALVDAEERTQLRDIERLTRQQIQAEDRRNDKSIAADPKQAARPEDRDPRRSFGGGDRNGRGGNRGGSRSGERGSAPRGRSHERSGERSGERRPEARGEARDAAGPKPWSNWSSTERPASDRGSSDRRPNDHAASALRTGDRRPAERSARDDRPRNTGNGDHRPARSAAPGGHRNGDGQRGAPRTSAPRGGQRSSGGRSDDRRAGDR